MNEAMRELCVVHLVRIHNGFEPFRRFLESYRANPGGIDHDLLITFKGFSDPGELQEFAKLLTPFKHLTLEVPDDGFDITAYLASVLRYADRYRYFCFLNSHSVILDRDWLEKLHRHIVRPGIGMVGATGSWQSHRGNTPTWLLPFAITKHFFQTRKEGGLLKRTGGALVSCLQDGPYLFDFHPFPNCHLRTNAFMISGDLMLRIKCPSMISKRDAYRFESGKNGLTMQVVREGKRVLVVGKDGIAYEQERWHESRTFWQSEQENLLVADNQTRDYAEGSFSRRDYLRLTAWGMDTPQRDGKEREDSHDTRLKVF